MNKVKVSYYGMVLGGALALMGCNDTGFTAAATATLPLSNGDSGTGGPLPDTDVPAPCPPSKTTKNIRILFMLDNSGSTLTTDPNQLYRVQSVQKFNSDHGASKPNLTYHLGYFGSRIAYMYDMILNRFDTPTAANPVGNSAQLATALSAYDAVEPVGSTPYLAAFSSLQDTVSVDPNVGVNKKDYAVVFMSDGQPTDIAAPVPANLTSLVNSLKAAASAKGSMLSVNTVYFGNPNDTVSIDNLRGMASTGGGQFVDTNKISGGIVIDDLINVPGACD